MALAAAAFLVSRPAAWAEGESPQPSSCEEDVRKLQAEGAEQLRQIEALRGVVAASERAWKENQALLESMRKQLHEELEARQASDVRKEKELTDASEALTAAKTAAARQSARVAELDRSVGELRRQVDLQRAERQKVASELSALRKAQDEAARSQAAELAARDAEAKRLGVRLAEVERERAGALAALQEQRKQLASAQRELESVGRDYKLAVQKARDLDRRVAELRAAAAEQTAAKQRLEMELGRLTQERGERAKRHETAAPRSVAGLHDSKPEPGPQGRPQTPKPTERAPKAVARISVPGADPTATPAERRPAKPNAQSVQRPSQDRVGALEAELTAIREREQTSRANAQELEETLAQERQVSRSKLEALQSVLKNTRSAGVNLRTQLDETRDKNAALSRQVTELKTAVGKVHELQTSFQQKSFRLEELAQTKDADTAEIRKLQSQRSSLAGEIRRARSEQVASAASVSRWMKAEELSLAPVPPPAGGAEEDDRAGGDLREQLSLERERRETLEEEVKRLTASGDSEEKFVEVWNTLQSARSQILVLTNQLADERRSRETLEIALTRMKEASGEEGQSTAEFATRLAETLQERRDEADRLADQLKNANEVIVRLKGRLEATGSPTAESGVVADVDQENQKLRETLRTAEEANRSLREKAEMAARLAEMVYGKAR
jgi:hypothetical protein